MAIWRFYSSQRECDGSDDAVNESIEVTRLKVPGAPVFSLAKIPEVLPDGTPVRKRKKPPGIYLGTAAKEVVTWMLGSKDVTDKVALGGHTGWVRSLAVTGKWLFSCGCNQLRLWDTTFSTPKEHEAVRLFTGDILAVAAAAGRVFTAGADGSLRSWSVNRQGELAEGPAVERAHEGRVAACVAHGELVVTASYDGSVKVWDAATLTLLAEAPDAHSGEKVFCAAVGPNGVLFTGGDDKFVRAWDLSLSPLGGPLEGHAAAVRVLAPGKRGLLVSGDADGDVCIWETYPVDLPPPPSLPPPPPAAVEEPAAVAADGSEIAAEAVLEAPGVVGVAVDEEEQALQQQQHGDLAAAPPEAGFEPEATETAAVPFSGLAVEEGMAAAEAVIAEGVAAAYEVAAEAAEAVALGAEPWATQEPGMEAEPGAMFEPGAEALSEAEALLELPAMAEAVAEEGLPVGEAQQDFGAFEAPELASPQSLHWEDSGVAEGTVPEAEWEARMPQAEAREVSFSEPAAETTGDAAAVQALDADEAAGPEPFMLSALNDAATAALGDAAVEVNDFSGLTDAANGFQLPAEDSLAAESGALLEAAHAADTNGYANGYVNGNGAYANGHANRHPNGHANGHEPDMAIFAAAADSVAVVDNEEGAEGALSDDAGNAVEPHGVEVESVAAALAAAVLAKEAAEARDAGAGADQGAVPASARSA